MELFAAIRRDARVEGLGVRALANRHGVHRRTVRQALASATPPARKTPIRSSPRLDPFKDTIDAMNRPGFGGGCHSTRGWTAWQHHGSTRQSFKSARHVSRSKLAKIRNGDEEQYAGWPSSSV